MNREQALSRFIKENTPELTDVHASKEIVKHLRQEFFQRNNLSSSERFSGREVAEHVCHIVTKARRGDTEDAVVQLLIQVPHVSEELGMERISELVRLDRLGAATRLTTDDLSRIGKEDFLEGLEHEFRRKAEEEAEQRLTDERKRLAETIDLLNAEHAVLDATRSMLESIPPDANLDLLIEEPPSSQAGGNAPIWWRELGLESDPFSSNRGLTGIPSAKYDDVVVKTSFFQSHIDALETTPESLFGKTVVTLGEFGSGKTTLFQVLGSKAVTKGILPIVTSLHPDVSVARLTSQLVGQMQESLLQSFPSLIYSYSGPETEAADDIGKALHSLAEAARRAPATKGFLLFVDGLHKTEMYLKQSLEFLSQLQTLQERFELRGLKLGVFVAGSTRWETELKANPALSGSFYSIEVIPPVSEDQAVEAVIRRVRSFTPPGSSPPTIIRAPLRVAYQVLVQRLLRPPTFRDYLDHVRDRFVAREYSNLGVSLQLHVETVRLVKGLIEKTSLAENYRYLLDPTKHSPRLKEGLKRVLPEVCARKGIREDDPFFKRYVGVFFLLKRISWIAQRSDPNDRKPVWHLSEEVVGFLQRVQEQKVLPTDALEALFTDAQELTPRETESIYGPLVRQMEMMLATWRAGLPEIASLIERSLSKVKSIDVQCRNPHFSQTVDISEDIRRSIEALVESINLVALGAPTSPALPMAVFGSLWCCPENYDGIAQMIGRRSVLDSTKPDSLGFLLTHAQVMSDLCELVTALVRGEGVCRLAGRKLTPAESDRLHEARTAFLNQRYQATVEQLCDVVEGKLRDVLFLSLRCLKGDKAALALPTDIRKRFTEAPRGHPRAKRGWDYNFLYDLNRSEYSKVLFSGEVKNALLVDLASADEMVTLEDNTRLLFSLGDREAHRDRPSYFRDHATEIGTVLQAAPRLCDLMNLLSNSLVVGAGFEVTQKDGSAEFRWQGSSGHSGSLLVDAVTIQNTVEAILGRLEADSFSFPPFEPPLLGIHAQPEVGLSVIRGAARNGLLEIESLHSGFGFRVSMTEKGKLRLESIRGLKNGRYASTSNSTIDTAS
jgi:hypothetical protein